MAGQRHQGVQRLSNNPAKSGQRAEAHRGRAPGLVRLFGCAAALEPINHYEVHHLLTKYAGLIYDMDSHHSAYVSYTDIFKPQNYYDVNHKLLSPVVGKNYEIGIKGAYFYDTLKVSLALFRMDQENRAARISDQTQCSNISDGHLL
ncbi:TonB-dependent receptor [Sphingobium sp.]|uniref:TonB-dependent receptor domain-containing protein n=1 Tax=Sphingobium sp. TaxID=1912891 RepID=UPI00257B4701|nr:TonB-dependent receptor [Sphingobium sp.]